jgi:RimJ/RimL family protein N-acetyltransferase
MPHLNLRFPEADDTGSLVEAVRESLPELLPWMPWCHAGYSAADAAQFIASRPAAREAWDAFDFVVVGAQGKLLGLCGINTINRENRFANLGYWVRTSERGRGVAAGAVGLLARWVFEHTDLGRLEIVAAVGNKASQRVAEKAGALHEGTLRSRVCIHGAMHDAHLFSLIRPQPEDGPAGAP